MHLGYLYINYIYTHWGWEYTYIHIYMYVYIAGCATLEMCVHKRERENSDDKKDELHDADDDARIAISQAYRDARARGLRGLFFSPVISRFLATPCCTQSQTNVLSANIDFHSDQIYLGKHIFLFYRWKSN